jgi:hypothetical protein
MGSLHRCCARLQVSDHPRSSHEYQELALGYCHQVFPEKCEEAQLGMPVPHHMTFHGGGGTILSVGLLRALNFTEWQECVESMKWRQGDTLCTGLRTTCAFLAAQSA